VLGGKGRVCWWRVGSAILRDKGVCELGSRDASNSTAAS